MTAQEVRTKFIEYVKKNKHVVIPHAPLVPENDSSTLFTGSGMQPLVNYFLGEIHPKGNRIADSQICFRSEDVDEVGDNRHTTFFEMLGNWSFGDYFKQEQLSWFFRFLTDELKLDVNRLYVTCFIGDKQANIAKDEKSVEIWQELFLQKNIDGKIVEIGSETDGYSKGMQGGRIFYYDSAKNWWSRSGKPEEMPVGEPGGPDSEVFYEFLDIKHDSKYGKHCHPNCNCGRFIEIGNSVFMEFVKQADGSFKELPKKNVDFGGGLERLTAAVNDSSDIFQISVFWPIIEKLQQISASKYEQHKNAFRIIADHLRAGVFLAADGVTPSNKLQGYVMRRIVRRSVRYALDIGIEQDLCKRIAPVITKLYSNDFPEVSNQEKNVITVLEHEERVFRQTLKQGLRQFERAVGFGALGPPSIQSKETSKIGPLTGENVFELYDTYGFPVELSIEEANKRNIPISKNWRKDFDRLMQEQRQRSQTASKGLFKGGLADTSEMTTKLHTATHLLNAALVSVLGSRVQQKGANVTAERMRFDFTHPQKVTPEEIAKIEQIVNDAITEDYLVTWQEENTKEALKTGAVGVFGHKYADKVRVYYVGDKQKPFSREICGGPHVTRTGELADGGKRFKITKEEASSAGVRRIKAVLI